MSRIGPWLGALGRVVRGGPAHQVRRIRLGPAGTPPAAVDGSGLPIATPAAAAESAGGLFPGGIGYAAIKGDTDCR